MTAKVRIEVETKGTGVDPDALAKKYAAFSTEMTKKTQAFNAVQKQKVLALAEAKRAEEAATIAQQKNRLSITDLNSAVQLAVMALQKLKQGYDFAKEGAQIEFTAIKFDRLARTIDTTGDALKDKLMVATRGTLSEMEAMASATDLVSLGLVKTEGDTVRLASVVAGLGMDMNQLVLALSNQTTMRFDQLGIAVVGFDEKVKKLEATGMSAQDAFTEAFLQQAEEQLIKVGNAADTGAGQFMKLEAAWKDFVDELKIGTANAVVPFIETMNEMSSASERVDEQYDNLTPRARNFMVVLEMQEGTLQRQETYYRNYSAAMEGATREQSNFSGAVERTSEILPLTEEQIKAISTENQQFLGVLGQVSTAQTTYYDGLAAVKQQLDEGKIKTAEHAAAVQQLSADYQAASQQIVLSIVEMKFASDGWTDAELNAYLKIGQGMGKFTQDQVNMAQGALKMADTLIATEGPMLHVGERAEDSAEMFGDMSDASAELGESLKKEVASGASAATTALLGIPTVINVDIYLRTHGGGSGFLDGFLEENNAVLCFVRGTLVTMSDGTRKPIEQIQIGDEVRSYNLDRREFVSGRVTKNFSRNVSAYLNIDGLRVTEEHPIWAIGRDEWVKAGEIKRGDILYRDYGGYKTVTLVRRVTADAEVFNMEVEGEHNYFAGGVLVHNKLQTGGEVYAGRPTLVGEAGPEPFIPASNGRILGHAESLHALSLGGGMGGGVTMYNYGTVTIAGDSETGGDFMSIR